MCSPLCPLCLIYGYCRRTTSLLVRDAEIANPEFVRDTRLFAHSLGISPDSWHDFIIDEYRDYPGRILDPRGNETFLNISVLEVPGIRDWFKAWACAPPSECATLRVRKEAWERVRIVTTILRARNPVEAQFWGLRAANDNEA